MEQALREHAIVDHPKAGRVYAFEVDAYGNYYCTDDGNIPSLLSLPYLGAVKVNSGLYQNTRRLLLSKQTTRITASARRPADWADRTWAST